MNEWEARRIIRRERLREMTLWFEPPNNMVERVGIARDESGWTVYATDERAAVQGIRRFSDESAALESFIDRARAARRMIDSRKRLGSALFSAPSE